MKRSLSLLPCALLFFLGVAASPATGQSDGGFTAFLEATDASDELVGVGTVDDRSGVREAIRRYYANTNPRTAWLEGGKPTALARRLPELLRQADQDGLDPSAYQPDALAARIESAAGGVSGQERYELDLALTRAFMVFGSHLASGRIHPENVDASWNIEPRRPDLAAALESAVESGDLEGAIERLRPPHRAYQDARGLLGRYRQLAADGGWPEVADGPVLEAGDTAPRARLETLVARLEAEGDLEAGYRFQPAQATAESEPASDESGESDEGEESGGDSGQALYDETLAEAVRRFQRRHGITVDGIVGPGTRGAMNVTAAERVDQILVNMERWRWLPTDLGDRRVEVNVAGYQVHGIENGEPTLTMKVVAGKASQRTPVFSDTITHAIVNPYWNVPYSISTEEILPKVQRDPGYLSANHYEVLDGSGNRVSPGAVNWGALSPGNFPYRIRQTPGPWNALGRVKYMFPNQYAIYLHDTPADHLFSEAERAFSHGCIRLERPYEFGGWLFGESSEWDEQRIEQQVASEERRRVELPKDIPVYILYWTVWQDDEGRAQLRDDVYGHDRALAEALGLG